MVILTDPQKGRRALGGGGEQIQVLRKLYFETRDFSYYAKQMLMRGWPILGGCFFLGGGAFRKILLEIAAQKKHLESKILNITY